MSNNPRVLVVEDDPNVRHAIVKPLAARGLDIREAEDGLDALVVLSKWSADVVITDLYMPNMDGFVLLQRLRVEHPRIGRIALSGSTSAETLAKIGAHCTFYSKPFRPQELYDAVQSVWSHARAPSGRQDRQKTTQNTISIPYETLERLVAQSEIGVLAAALSHDMSSALQGVVGNLYIAEHDLRELPKSSKKPAIEDALECIEGASRSCDQLLELFRRMNAARRRKDAPASTDVVAAVRAALATIKTQNRRVLFIEQIRLRATAAKIDELDLQRLVTNLVRNATQWAAKESPKVLMKLTLRRDTAEARKGIDLLVEDNGIGIDAAIRDRLFDPFVTTRTESGGTGLGLWIVRQIARRYGGDVELVPGVLGGAAFRVFLPVIEVKSARPPSGDVPRTEPAAKTRPQRRGKHGGKRSGARS